MKPSLIRLQVIAVCGLVVGCTQSVSEPGNANQNVQSATQRPSLPDIDDPDDDKRDVNGIQIIGSALTDVHIDATRKLTDDTRPAKTNRYLLREIMPTGKNAATNTWQTGHFQLYQKLELKRGEWQIIESGGGFGQW